MRPTSILLTAAIVLGVLCGFAFGQGSTGGWGGYFYTPTYETVYEAPVSYYETPMYSAGSMGGSYARYSQPISYSYVPYQQNNVWGSYYGNRPVYVLYYMQ